MGGTGYDYCKDIDWAKDSIVISGDYSSDMNLSGVSISLSEEYGSFCAKYSTNGSLLNYYTLESDGSLSAEKICYNKSDDSFLLMGAFSKELNTKDSFLPLLIRKFLERSLTTLLKVRDCLSSMELEIRLFLTCT